MYWIIDRFEGEFAVLESEDTVYSNVPRAQLPDDVKEGDVLIMRDHGYVIDSSRTMARKARIESLMNDLFS